MDTVCVRLLQLLLVTVVSSQNENEVLKQTLTTISKSEVRFGRSKVWTPHLTTETWLYTICVYICVYVYTYLSVCESGFTLFTDWQCSFQSDWDQARLDNMWVNNWIDYMRTSHIMAICNLLTLSLPLSLSLSLSLSLWVTHATSHSPTHAITLLLTPLCFCPAALQATRRVPVAMAMG